MKKSLLCNLWLYDSHGSKFCLMHLCIFSMPLWSQMLRAGKQPSSKAAVSLVGSATFHPLTEMLLLFSLALLFPFIYNKSHSESV